MVWLREDNFFTINSNNNFGLAVASAGGIYGEISDASCDIFQYNEIGPISKWVNNHIFSHIQVQHVPWYNNQQQKWHHAIIENGGRIYECSSLWYKGKMMPDDTIAEFDEDTSLPIKIQSCKISAEEVEPQYTYYLRTLKNGAVWTQNTISGIQIGPGIQMSQHSRPEKNWVSHGNWRVATQAATPSYRDPETIWEATSHVFNCASRLCLFHMPGMHAGFLHTRQQPLLPTHHLYILMTTSGGGKRHLPHLTSCNQFLVPLQWQTLSLSQMQALLKPIKPMQY